MSSEDGKWRLEQGAIGVYDDEYDKRPLTTVIYVHKQGRMFKQHTVDLYAQGGVERIEDTLAKLLEQKWRAW
jgi:hypothetical protein